MTRAWHQNIKKSPASERTDADGNTFDSKAELRRWEELKLMERAGQISGLRRQVPFVLAFEGRPVKIRSKGFPNGRPCVYTLDFLYTDNATGRLIREEYKGVDDGESRLRRAVVEALYKFEITVTGPASKNTPRRETA